MRASLAGGAGLICGAAGYGAFIEPEKIELERLQISLPRLPQAFDGLKIAQLSDLHYGPFTGAREISAAANRVNELSADLFIITGDFITSPWLEHSKAAISTPMRNVALCARILSQVRTPLGTFAALGNHDVSLNAPYITEVLESFDVRVLSNRNFPLERGGARLWLAGIDDVIEGVARLDLALAGIPRNEPVVLLVHEPDFADAASRQAIDLQLSGHSHGGQVRIPLIGSPYLPLLARKYPYGYYRVGRLQLYTNRGIGTIGLPLRFDAPPEVTLFTLRAGRETLR